MAEEVIQTVFGLEIYNPAPICAEPGCERHCHCVGYGRYRRICYHHHVLRTNIKRRVHIKHRKDYCENIDGRLGFKCTYTILKPEWQLHGDHSDGDHANNEPDNVVTLCANCHAFKTAINRENLPVHMRPKALREQLIK